MNVPLSAQSENRSAPRRGAMNVTECATLGVISLVLLALCVAGLLQARQSAADARVKYQLRTTGQGLLMYHDVARSFPAGGGGTSSSEQPREEPPRDPASEPASTSPQEKSLQEKWK